MRAERKDGKEAIFWECRGTLNVVTPFIARVAIISTESWSSFFFPTANANESEQLNRPGHRGGGLVS